MPDRDADASAQMAVGLKSSFWQQPGIGIAIETLIDITVRVTITHRDNAPIANAAATASVSRDDATGAERALNPAPPGDRFMARDPSKMHGRESLARIEMSQETLAILRRVRLKDGKTKAAIAVMPAIFWSRA